MEVLQDGKVISVVLGRHLGNRNRRSKPIQVPWPSPCRVTREFFALSSD